MSWGVHAVQAVFSFKKIVDLPNLHMNQYLVPFSISIRYFYRFLDTGGINDSPRICGVSHYFLRWAIEIRWEIAHPHILQTLQWI